MPDKDIVQNYVTELKRGNLVLAVLGSLDTPHYGYALLQTLQERGMEIEANTLYPLLRSWKSRSCWKVIGIPLKADRGSIIRSAKKVKWLRISCLKHGRKCKKV